MRNATRTWRPATWVAWIATMCLLAATAPLHGQCELAKLIPDDAGPSDNFGTNLAYEKGTLLVGVGLDDDVGPDAGAAYVFEGDGASWVQTTELHASDGEAFDGFGISASLSGDTILIGAPFLLTSHFGEPGAAYVFERGPSGWVETGKLLASDGEAGDWFGTGVALSRDTAMVFADYASGGRLYVFERGPLGWSETAILVGPAGSDLTPPIVMHGDVAVTSGKGAVHVFERRDAWRYTATLTASGLPANELFGGRVALAHDGDRILASAYASTVLVGTGTGSGVVFDRVGTGWEQTARLAATEAVIGDLFGLGVALHGDMALIGAPSTDIAGQPYVGAAYVFQETGRIWQQTARLTASDGEAWERFGNNVLLTRRVGFVSATTENSTAVNNGAVYAYGGLTDLDTWTDLGEALPGSDGTPCLYGTGELLPRKTSTLTLVRALENSTSALVLGLTTLFAPFQGGVLVPSPDVILFGLPIDRAGKLELSFDWPARLPDEVVTYWQHWIADPGAPFGWSASNAVRAMAP